MSEVVIAAQQQAVACPEYNTKMGTEQPTPKSLLVSTPFTCVCTTSTSSSLLWLLCCLSSFSCRSLLHYSAFRLSLHRRHAISLMGCQQKISKESTVGSRAILMQSTARAAQSTISASLMVSASSLISGIGSGVTPVQILHFKIPPVLNSVSLVKVIMEPLV